VDFYRYLLELTMQMMTVTQFLVIGLLLGAAFGIKATIPLVAVSAATQIGLLSSATPSWLASPAVLLVLSCALLAALVIEYLPGVTTAHEHTVAAVVRPLLSGAIAAGLVPPDVMHVTAAFLLGAMPAWAVQWHKKWAKLFLGLDPITNTILASIGIAASCALSAWAIFLMS
jgi:hypothetical protein